MKKAWKRFIRMLSVFLVALLLLEVVPMQVLAAAQSNPTETETAADVAEENEAEVIYEIEEERDAYTKVYKKSDQTYTAMVSSTPLHYLQDGKWVDIDNTLTSESLGEETVLTNAENPLAVAFPETLSQENGISLQNGAYSLEFTVEGVRDSDAELQSAQPAEELPVGAESLKTQSETAVYANALPHTDLEYSISSTTVKENIILGKRSAVQTEYRFRMTAAGLDAVCTESGEVVFAASDGTGVFTVPAPFMKDDANAVSTDIAVSLEEVGGNTYILSYRPSQEWLLAADRKYPVVLDPVVELEDAAWFDTVCVHTETPDAGYPNENFSMVVNELVYGRNDEIGASEVQAETYVKLHLDKIGILTETVTPTDVELVFSGQGYNLAAYEIASPLDTSSVTYNTKPQLALDRVVDYYTGMRNVSEAQKVHFNITKLFWQWLSGEKENNGLAIYSYDDTAPAYGVFFGEQAQDRGISLLIDFVESTGYSERFDYHTQDIARAGTAYINDFTQRLLIKRDDIAISGNVMPINIAFLYNPALLLKADKFAPLMTAMGMEEEAVEFSEVYGNGWLTNYNRCLYWNPMLSDDGCAYCYTDENGSIVHFSAVQQEDGSTAYLEETVDGVGGGYELFVSDDAPNSVPSASMEDIRLRKPNGEIEQFDAYGRLIKIYKEKYPSQSVDIAYVVSDFSESGQTELNFYAIDCMTDGVGRKYDFVYNAENGLLQNIQCLAADGTAIKGGTTSSNLQMAYAYDENGNLTKVTYPDNGTAGYQYNAAGRLSTASSGDTYKLIYDYDDFGRINGVAENAEDVASIIGNMVMIDSDGPKQVTFSDLWGNRETIQFDRYGRTGLVTDARGNYIDSASGVQRTAGENLLVNQGFENGLTDWTCSDTLSVSEEFVHSGSKSVRFASSRGVRDSVAQTVSAGSGTYTFSAYIKAQGGLSAEEKLIMRCTALDAAGEILSANMRTVAATSTEFSRCGVVLNAPENTAAVAVSIQSDSDAGVFYADSLQLEKGSGFGAYNLLANNSLAAADAGTVSNWISDSSYACSTQTVNMMSCNTVCFPASKHADYTLSQTVSLNGHAGDAVCFGGWLQADVISNGDDCRLAEMFPQHTQFSDDRFAGFTLTYTYTTEEDGAAVTKTETVKKAANDFISDWQFVEEYVILKGDCTEVTFAFEYSKHPSAVSVAMPVLSFEAAPAMEETEAQEKLETPEDTQTPDLCVCGETCEYGGGCPCTCASAEECDCPECKGCVCSDCTRLGCTCRCESEEVCDCPQCKKLFDVTYDEFGNLLSLSVSGYDYDLNQLLSMFMRRSFSANGNYMTSSTNENGGTVTYNYNAQNGVLQSETDARGNATEYSYNAMGALTQVKTPVSGLAKEALGLIQPTSMTTAYSYKNDRVTSIRHNDFSYYIDYDQWGNVTRVYADTAAAVTGSVLNSQMAQYYYGTGCNHSRLEKIRYGNNDTVNYRYDEYNRVVGISYDGGNTDRFTYGYDTLGNVVLVRDAQMNRTVLYNEASVEVYQGGKLLYYMGTDAEGNRVEYNGDSFVTVTKAAESTRNAETGVTASKTEISTDTCTVDLLKSTDAFGRTQQTASLVRSADGSEETPFAATVTDYTYKTQEDGTAAGRVDTLQTRLTYGTSMAAENTVKRYGLAYDYDANGNITREYEISANGSRIMRYRYTYDEANQLTRIDDGVQGKTHTYQYDKGGNRVSEKIYPFTVYDHLGTAEKEIKSGYDYAVWNDRLSTYDGKIIMYDVAGNPTVYGDTNYSWDGKFLTQIQLKDGSKTQFDYDADGLRTQKRQYNTDGKLDYSVSYVWLDGKLVQQSLKLYGYGTVGGKEQVTVLGPFTAKMIYGDSDQPQACIIDGTQEFLFVRNLQGDIIAVANADGEVVIEYTYDPWGKIDYHFTSNDAEENEALQMLVGIFCPLTYRGYNYDFTTGLYYLQSRYYNPEWGRFLNVDDTSVLLATQGETHNANLFAYCNNNPVNNVDPTGMKPKFKDNESIGAWVGTFFGVLIIMAPYISDNIDNYFKFYSNGHLCKISIKLTSLSFFNAILTCIQLNDELTFQLLAIVARQRFEEKTGRYFLFSDDCMAYEIKFHFDLYASAMNYQNGIINGTLTPALSGLLYVYFQKHCETIDISEGDVYNSDQAITFRYRNGIRNCYINTLADPYRIGKNQRSSKAKVPKSRNDWERWLHYYGSTK